MCCYICEMVGVVRKVDKEEEILMVSLREDQLEESLQHVKLV